jgi:hypothetical protein
MAHADSQRVRVLDLARILAMLLSLSWLVWPFAQNGNRRWLEEWRLLTGPRCIRLQPSLWSSAWHSGCRIGAHMGSDLVRGSVGPGSRRTGAADGSFYGNWDPGIVRWEALLLRRVPCAPCRVVRLVDWNLQRVGDCCSRAAPDVRLSARYAGPAPMTAAERMVAALVEMG